MSNMEALKKARKEHNQRKMEKFMLVREARTWCPGAAEAVERLQSIGAPITRGQVLRLAADVPLRRRNGWGAAWAQPFSSGQKPCDGRRCPPPKKEGV